MNDEKAAELVTRFEHAILEAGHLHRAYEIARLVPGTNTALTDLFNAMEDAQAQRDRCRLAVLRALAGDDS